MVIRAVRRLVADKDRPTMIGLQLPLDFRPTIAKAESIFRESVWLSKLLPPQGLGSGGQLRADVSKATVTRFLGVA